MYATERHSSSPAGLRPDGPRLGRRPRRELGVTPETIRRDLDASSAPASSPRPRRRGRAARSSLAETAVAERRVNADAKGRIARDRRSPRARRPSRLHRLRRRHDHGAARRGTRHRAARGRRPMLAVSPTPSRSPRRSRHRHRRSHASAVGSGRDGRRGRRRPPRRLAAMRPDIAFVGTNGVQRRLRPHPRRIPTRQP